MTTQTVEKYLKAIHRLLEEDERVGTSALAETLGVRPASVTGMLQRLSQSDPPLLEYQPQKGVAFTEAGRKVALRAIRHHRLLELYLYQLLGYSWDRVHDEAERMDHVISDEFGDKLSELMNNPRFDPHGDPIPTRDLKLPQRNLISLRELTIGQGRIIRRVGRDDPEFLRYLNELGLMPGKHVKLLRREPFNGPITLEVKIGKVSMERLIGYEIAGDLLVDRQQE
jgi:DtxR family Mn-dependent transcriptional regulator